jgi:hypothetical protein
MDWARQEATVAKENEHRLSSIFWSDSKNLQLYRHPRSSEAAGGDPSRFALVL